MSRKSTERPSPEQEPHTRKINQLLVEPSDELTSAADLALVHGHGPRINWKGPLTDNWVHSNYNFSTGAASSFYDIEQDVFPYHPKGLQFNRIRPSYNASFVEPASLGSSSPLSYAYTWTSKNSSQTPSTVPCVTPSYAMGAMPMSDGVNSKSEHGYYRLKSLAERDEDETALLCQGESFDLVPNSYTREEYMDNYWKYFHPQFPIVHKATFGNNISPLLCAAMYAIGGQYSNDPSTRKRSRILHDRGVKILAKRNELVILEPDRLCDDQAVLLLEILSQYRGRRAPKALSRNFKEVYLKMHQNSQIVVSRITEVEDDLMHLRHADDQDWNMWIELTSQQRLFQCCYLLECQQSILLARSLQPSLIPGSEFDLTFPAHSSLWDANSPPEWKFAVQQCVNMPRYIHEITTAATSPLNTGLFDIFQSSLIIADRYNLFNGHALLPSHPCSSNTFQSVYEPLLSCSPIIKHQLLTAKLVHATPVRSLLAVSGESWILSEKVPSAAAMHGHRSTLQSWVNGIRTSDNESQRPNVAAAVELAIGILQHAIMSPTGRFRLEFGGEMGLYFAVMVIWAITVAANDGLNTNDLHDHLPEDFLRANASANTSQSLTFRSLGDSDTADLPSADHISSASTSISIYQIIMDSIKLLEFANSEVAGPSQMLQGLRHDARSQQGCTALMRWVKMRISIGDMDLQNVQDVSFANTYMGEYGAGELLDAIINSLERAASRLSTMQPFPSPVVAQNTSMLQEETPLIELCVESDWQTEDSMSETDFSQSLTGLVPSVSLAAIALYNQFQMWQRKRVLSPLRDQAVTGQNDTDCNRSTAGGATSNSTTEATNIPSSHRSSQRIPLKRLPNDDDDNDDDRRPARRRKLAREPEDFDSRLLACPFAKHHPFRHRKCFKYVLQDIARLKQHLLRVHRIPVHCARCSNIFTTEDERDTHLRRQPQCQIDLPRNWDGISESQKRQLAKRVSSKKTKEENWYFIYETLFPNSDRPDTPFIDDVQLSEELLALREFVIREAPDRITQYVDSELPPNLRPNRDNVEAFTQAAVRGVFDILLERWESSSVPSHVLSQEVTREASLQRSDLRSEPNSHERSQSVDSGSGLQFVPLSRPEAILSSDAYTSIPTAQNISTASLFQPIVFESSPNVSDSVNRERVSQSEAISNAAAAMGPAWDFEETFDSSLFDFNAFLEVPNVEIGQG